MLKAVIVDDEKISRDTLATYLEKYCKGDVHVMAQADSVKTGLDAIAKINPDILFLDIEMPHGNAFDLLEKIEEITFETVFVTAYSDYALKAINFCAAYYILKPINIDELIEAVERVKLQKQKQQDSFRTRVLVENLQLENKQLQKIVLPLLDGFEVVQVKDIVRCEAKDNFTEFHLAGKTKKLICRTLKFYDELLVDFGFFRIHKSHLVNLQFINRYKKGKGGQVFLDDGSVVDVSPLRKKDFLAMFG